MSADELDVRRREIVDRHGPWTLHNIELDDRRYTMGSVDAPATTSLLRRVVQGVCDLSRRPVEELRVLDLASHEGQYAIEFARRGAEVVAIEGRAGNLAKARLVADWFGLDRVSFLEGDVRSLSATQHGRFDVVLCLGILYHLGPDDALGLLRSVADVCSHLAVVDTHTSSSGRVRHRSGDREYRGHLYREHGLRTQADERERALNSSLEEPVSFWLTRASLYNALSDVGFSFVAECVIPGVDTPADRPTLVAVNGRREEVLSLPAANAVAEWRWPEGDRPVHPGQRLHRRALARLTALAQSRYRRADP